MIAEITPGAVDAPRAPQRAEVSGPIGVLTPEAEPG
jgi:hypothetical protein